jgi:hypothetical protein
LIIYKINKMKQTAVEWLIEIYLTTGIDRNVHFHQAKEMEKEQIIEAWIATDNELQRIAAQQYYNETFKSE